MKGVVKRKSTKTAFDGDFLQACKLTDDTISEILQNGRRSKRIRANSGGNDESRDFDNQYSDGGGFFQNRSKPVADASRNSRIRINEKPKTVSFG